MIENLIIIDIYQIPIEFIENYKFYFYSSSGNKVYLLRFRNLKTEFYELNDEAKDLGNLPYLIAGFSNPRSK